MRTWLSVGVAIGAALAVGCGQISSPTSATSVSSSASGRVSVSGGTLTAPGPIPTLRPAQAVCEKDGGFFLEGGFAYRCQFSGPTSYQEAGARSLCEKGYGGIFAPEDDNYLCRW
jgi:hypothetical protein